MILGKCWLIQDDIKVQTNGENKVFKDKFWGRGHMDNPSSANSMSNRGTISDMEVRATLSGFQYQESQRSFYSEVLKSDISIHLLSKLSPAPRASRARAHTPALLGQPVAPAHYYKYVGKVSLATWWT